MDELDEVPAGVRPFPLFKICRGNPGDLVQPGLLRLLGCSAGVRLKLSTKSAALVAAVAQEKMNFGSLRRALSHVVEIGMMVGQVIALRHAQFGEHVARCNLGSKFSLGVGAGPVGSDLRPVSQFVQGRGVVFLPLVEVRLRRQLDVVTTPLGVGRT